MTGFSETTITLQELPELPPYAPFIFDDCSLAFFLGIRTKTLWWMMTETNKQYAQLIIKKRNGGDRIIHRPTAGMRCVSQRINHRILDPLQSVLGDHVAAYRSGMSVRDAVLQHIPPCPVCDALDMQYSPPKHECPRKGTFIKLDLKDFFSRTSRSFVRNYFKSVGYSHDVAGYLAAMTTVGNIPNKRYKEELKLDPDARKFFYGVPQGAPSSGAVCNLVADRMIDQKILGILRRWDTRFRLEAPWNFRYTRYADDMTITCGPFLDEPTCKELLHELITTIRSTGYNVNPRKTKVSRYPTSQRRLLGMLYHRHPNYDRYQYRKLRSVVNNCKKHGFNSQFGSGKFDTVWNFYSWLHGTVNWVNQINPNKGNKLIQELSVAREIHDREFTEEAKDLY